MDVLKCKRSQLRRLFTKALNDFEKKFDESECYIDKWRIAESKLASLLTGKYSISVVNESFNQNAVLRYPKLKLPTFDGNVKNWLGYWRQSKKIDTHSNLDDHDKFAYLLQSMEKGSSAEELIKSFSPSGESYSKRLQQLQSRFGKEDHLIEVYVRGLLALVLLKNSQQKFSLRKLYDNLESSAPCNTKHVGFKNRVEFKEAPTASTLIAISEKNPNACIFCSGIHEFGECFKARKMSSEEKQKAVQNSRSCFLCLEKGHVIAKCRRKTSCMICGKKHGIHLCRNIQAGSKSPVSVNIRKGESKETVPQRDETLANLVRTPNLLLQTLMVTLRGQDEKRQALAIIDSASQRSYILKSTADEMQFESSFKEKLTCTDVIKFDAFTVFLYKTDGT
ncbi:hypothetical protein AVEN_91017-1 [Araneus ventricosus]|uniref:Peptidase aspartic putative domain-containing protein n=1 Tax=Araneus ventricosus TaxID=182803 RepID=A0A4Y2S5E3_ARAVE|nr:hypothetical protein AVEN_91017-1 [Araneus ventricosus]